MRERDREKNRESNKILCQYTQNELIQIKNRKLIYLGCYF